ncbi:MAG: DUF1573 domain-containing protein, partial [Bacteroidales bacterium]
MKFIYYVTVFLIVCMICNSCGTGNSKHISEYSASDTAVIEFNEYEYDFGKIIAGEKVASIFLFKNTGKGPLIINAVTTSCGCTVPRYSAKPVLPGETGTIEVVFDSGGYEGIQKTT